jgi:hypothetical protein
LFSDSLIYLNTTPVSFTGTGVMDNSVSFNSTTIAVTTSIACAGIVTANMEVNEISEQFNIYPTSDRVTLSGVKGQPISAYNTLGILVRTELKTATANCQLDLSQQSNGIYFVKIGTFTKKIIKE